MRRVPVIGERWRSLPALGLLAGSLFLQCGRAEPLRFAVTFEEANGIRVKAPVVHRGLEVGRVTGVGLDEQGLVLVSVEVEDRYRTAVGSNSTLRIEASGLRRRRHLVIVDGPGERRPLRDGEVLTGSEGAVDDWLERVAASARQLGDRTLELADDVEARVRELGSSEEARELVEGLRRVGSEAEKRTVEGWQRFRDEELPVLRERATELRRRLIEEGRLEEAEELERTFERWRRELPGDHPRREAPPEREP